MEKGVVSFLFKRQGNWSTEWQGACPRSDCRSEALLAWNPGSHGLELTPSPTGLERLSDGPECVWEEWWFSFGGGRLDSRERSHQNKWLPEHGNLKELYFLLALILKLSLGLLFSWMGTDMASEQDFWRYDSGTNVQWQTGHSGRDHKGRCREQAPTKEASAGLQSLGAEEDAEEKQDLSHAKV